jgi:hypothetical protein
LLEEPSSQTESMKKADDIFAEVDYFKEALENHYEVCDVLNVKLNLVILKLFLFKFLNFLFKLFTFSTSQTSTSSSNTFLECFHYLP